MPVLAIIDEGTTGLTGNNWDNLVIREGQPAGALQTAHGGSYGFGKHAPLNLSQCHAVLYGTQYLANPRQGRVTKLGGRAQLISHPDPESKDNLQAVGFYGKHEGQEYNKPLTGNEIANDFNLDETGTAVYIIAFDDAYADWDQRVAHTATTDFFAAIHDRKLRIEISRPGTPKRIIDRDSLAIAIDALPPNNDTRFFYNAYRTDEPIKTTPSGRLGGMGQLELYTVIAPKAPKKVAHVNRRGMLITTSRQTTENPFYPTGGRHWSPWAGVTCAADEATDAFIRRTEPPAHNAIQYKLLTDPNESGFYKAEYQHQREQINEAIRKLITAEHESQGYDVKELAELFPDLPDANSGAIDLTTTPVNEFSRNDAVGEHWAEDPDTSEEMPRVTYPTGSKPGPTPDPPRPSQDPPLPPHTPGGVTTGQRKAGTSTIRNSRVMRRNQSQLGVGFTIDDKAPPEGIYFALRQAGEQHMPDEPRIPLNNASSENVAVRLLGDTIVHVQGKAGTKARITLTLQNHKAGPTGIQLVQIEREHIK